MTLIKPKVVVIIDPDGKEKTFTISRLPATVGREIAYQFLPANLPGTANYTLSKELSDKMMSHVTVKTGDIDIPLNSDALINAHTGHWEVLSKLEDKMLEYNTSFLADDKSTSLTTIVRRVSLGSYPRGTLS